MNFLKGQSQIKRKIRMKFVNFLAKGAGAASPLENRGTLCYDGRKS